MFTSSENTRIVVMFSLAFFALCAGIMNLVSYAKGAVVGRAVNFVGSDSTSLYALEDMSLNFFKTKNIATTDVSFSQAPIANVPLTNQTSEQLSQAFLCKSELKGAMGNTIASHDVDWAVEGGARGVESYSEILNMGASDVIYDGAATNGADASSSMIAIVHDPSLQYIAIACLFIFSVLICFSIWKFKKNKNQTL